ncbi:MAG: NupC/NupG family nucleoside CNT transporter, partial [Actinomycetota bacterium]|nr:NupC/NupG family nucleoside CNT transporter [Actinomycetota bacterium]
MRFLWGIGGIIVLLGLALAMSTDRRAINLRTVGVALAIEIGFAVLVLYWDTGADALAGAANGVQQAINAANAGIDFLFGGLLTAVPDDEEPVFALQVLPIIVYFAALMSMLYHLGILQAVVRLLGGALRWLLGTSRPESLSVTADIFVGPTEAPLVVRPYIARMTDSELFAVMTGGLTTVAGSVLVGYSLLGAPLDYLIAASFMAAPASLLTAKIVILETLE